jgi:hypothetical protein
MLSRGTNQRLAKALVVVTRSGPASACPAREARADANTSKPTAYGENYNRLVMLKRKYDPDNLFRLNQNVQP